MTICYVIVENGEVIQKQPTLNEDESASCLFIEAPEWVIVGTFYDGETFRAPHIDIPPPQPRLPAPGLIGSAGFTIADGAVTTVELAAQLTGAYYEQGYVQVFFLETQTLPYLVFVQTDIPCKVEQYKEPGALELVFSDPLTGDPIDLGRIDLQILNVR